MRNKPHTKDPEYQIFQLVQGQLAQPQAKDLRARVDSEPDLARSLRLEEALEEHLDTLAGEELPFDAEDLESQRAEIVSSIERRVLLEGSSRGRILRHPLRSALAAAAAVLIGLGVALWVIQEPASPSGPVAQVRMVRPEGPDASVSRVSVSARRGLDYDEFALAPASPVLTAATDAPNGTVVLSFGEAPSVGPEAGTAPPVGL